MTPPDRLNVLMIAAQQTGGGAGRAGERLAQALREQGHSAISFVRDNLTADPHCRQPSFWRTRPLANWLAQRGFPDVGHVESLLWPCHADFAAADVLHLNNIHGEFLSLPGLPLWGWAKPIVWTLHDFWALTGNCATPRGCTRWRQACGSCPLTGVYPMAERDRSSIYRRLKPHLIRAARPRLVTPSRWLAERVREVTALRHVPVRVIRYPIDTDAFTPAALREPLRRRFGLAPDRPTIVMSGNSWLDPFKGPADAVRALRRLRESTETAQLLVIGTGSERLLAATGLSGIALPFLRERSALAEAYAAADVCLFPSRAENYPLTVLESLASGTPVVAYDVGGIPEQIESGVTGFIASDGDVDALAAGLRRALGSEPWRRAAAAAGRAFVVRTSAVDVVRTQYTDEYRRAIAAWLRRRGRTTPRSEPGHWSKRIARALGWEPAHRLRPAREQPLAQARRQSA